MKISNDIHVPALGHAGPSLPEIKGHTKIILTDAKSGKINDIIEKDNMITNAVPNMFRTNYFGNTMFGNNLLLPIRQLFGGVMCFENPITENANNIYPPCENENRLVAHAGYNTNAAVLNPKLGTLSNLSAQGADRNSYTYIWDFGPDKGNGIIQSVCLTSKWGGNVGLTPNQRLDNCFNFINITSGRHFARSTDYDKLYTRNANQNIGYQWYDYNTNYGYGLQVWAEDGERAPGRSDGWGQTRIWHFTFTKIKINPLNYGLNDYPYYNTWSQYKDNVRIFYKTYDLTWNSVHNTGYYSDHCPEPIMYPDPDNNRWIVLFRGEPNINASKCQMYEFAINANDEIDITLLNQSISSYSEMYARQEIYSQCSPKIPIHDNSFYYPIYSGDYRGFHYLRKVNISTGETTQIEQVQNPATDHPLFTFYAGNYGYTNAMSRWVGNYYSCNGWCINNDLLYPCDPYGSGNNMSAEEYENRYYTKFVEPNPISPLWLAEARGNDSNVGSGAREEFFTTYLFTPYLATINNLASPVSKTEDQAMQIQYTLTQV